MSDGGWFFLGLIVGACLFCLVLTYVEARWGWISGHFGDTDHE